MGIACEKPDVLFIAIDDLNDWIGVLAGTLNHELPALIVWPNVELCYKLPFYGPRLQSLACRVDGWYRTIDFGGLSQSADVAKRGGIVTAFHAAWVRGDWLQQDLSRQLPAPALWNKHFPTKTKTRPNDPSPEGRPLDGIQWTRHFDWGPCPLTTKTWQSIRLSTGWLINSTVPMTNNSFWHAELIGPIDLGTSRNNPLMPFR